MRGIFGSMILLTACVTQAQGVVRCQDQDGKTVYVDRPCSAYGLRDVGPVKDRATFAPREPSAEPVAEPAPPVPEAAEKKSGVPRPAAKPRLSARQRAIQRCKRNRGMDCDSDAGLEEWLRQDKPPTEEERQAAIGARRFRERCEKISYSTPECDLLRQCDSTQNLSPDCASLPDPSDP